MFKHILLPTDGSDLATAAMKRGISLAKEMGARVTLIGVVEAMHVPTVNPAKLDEALAARESAEDKHLRDSFAVGEAEAKAAGVEARSLVARAEGAAEEIVRTAEREGCDLIALASHGRSGLKKLALGSQTQRVISIAPVPVLVLR